MYPHPVPTHAHVDAKVLGLEREALPWLLVGVAGGLLLSALGSRAVDALLPVVCGWLALPAPAHRSAFVPLVLLLVGFLPCYLLGRWRPEGRDPLGLLLARLKDAARPHECAWEPDDWAPPGGYADEGPRRRDDPDEEEEV